MKLDSKTALGIDIADKVINVALLKRNKNGVELIKTASGPVPEGALKNGNVEDPALLARAIRALVSRSHIRVRLRQAAVSLAARPVLLQIMEMPKSVSGGQTSIGQFVHNEVKNCVALSGKRIALDFCGIGSGGRAGSERLLVVAADNRNVAQIVKTCNLARVNVEVIEPPVLAYARAFYAKKIAGKFDCKVLLAAISGGTLTLCVFKRQAVDFVRTRDINGQKEPSALCQRVASEIKAIIQFYDSAPDSDQGDQAEGLDRIKPAFGGPAKWEITVIADRVQLPEDAEELLKAKLTESSLQVRCPEDACHDTSVVRDPTSREPRDSARLGKGPRLRGGKLAPKRAPALREPKSGASVAAIGLAMKLLGPDASNLRINLLPPEAAEVKAFKRHALITANVIAVVLFGMVIAIGGLMLMIEKTSENIVREKQGQSLQDTSALLMEERMLDKQIKQLSDGPGQLNEILSSHRDGDWLGILSDLRSRVPKAVCIRDLKSSGNSKIFLEGLALSYESVHLFVNMLDQSQYVDSASLIEAEKDSKEGGLVRYAISCQLRAAEGK